MGDGRINSLRGWLNSYSFITNSGGVIGANLDANYTKYLGHGIAEEAVYFSIVPYFSRYVGFNAGTGGETAALTEYQRVYESGAVSFFGWLNSYSFMANAGGLIGANIDASNSKYLGHGMAEMTNYFTTVPYFSRYVGSNAGTGGEPASLTEYQRVGSDRAVTFMGPMQFSAYGPGVLTTDPYGNMSAAVGVSCSGPPSGSFSVANGVVTHC